MSSGFISDSLVDWVQDQVSNEIQKATKTFLIKIAFIYKLFLIDNAKSSNRSSIPSENILL